MQTPEGHDLLNVTCSGFDHPANKCERIANEECPGGYTLLSNTNASFGGWRNWFALGFNVQDAMTFQCHKRNAPAASNNNGTILLKKTIITTTKDKNGNIVSTTTNVETGAK
ncbi:acyl- dehydrogenase [Lasius niger]|uniref:Acyl-dehydrogenase n=1 Tax=Lasius niger TaxID=67767 RepID=A0A0J7NMU1_LASNI|nr:acyl- dehydrogenase [Lasius niger]